MELALLRCFEILPGLPGFKARPHRACLRAQAPESFRFQSSDFVSLGSSTQLDQSPS
jgi:hypothetical protein